MELRGKGRHDSCVPPRAEPMVEAMMALTLLDPLLLQTAQCALFPNELVEQPNPLGKTAKRAGYDPKQHAVLAAIAAGSTKSSCG